QIAAVSGERFRSTSSGSIVQVPGRQSANTGVSPFHNKACAVAAKVNDGTMTSFPGRTPRAPGINIIPAVHVDSDTKYRAPVWRHTSSSRALTVGPTVTVPEAQLGPTSRTISLNDGSVGRMMGKFITLLWLGAATMADDVTRDDRNVTEAELGNVCAPPQARHNLHEFDRYHDGEL